MSYVLTKEVAKFFYFSPTKDEGILQKIKVATGNLGVNIFSVDNLDFFMTHIDKKVDCVIYDAHLVRDFEAEFKLHELMKKNLIENVVEITKSLEYDGVFNIIANDDNLENNLRDIFYFFTQKKRYETKIDRRVVIREMLFDWGFSPKLMGLTMLTECALYNFEQDYSIKNLLKEAYNFLAEKFKISTASVEFNIRKAIVKTFETSKTFPFSHCPTNKEFLIFMVSQLSQIFGNEHILSSGAI